jgi:ribose 5-phosphate isomerase B
MKIFLASDHAGFELKEFLTSHLKYLEFNVEDCGAYEMDASDDYPDFIIPAAQKVAHNLDSRGIIMGGSGQGEAIAANRIKGVRATVYYDGPIDIIKLSRSHNNANILSFGARFISNEKAAKAVKLWLYEPFEGGRHQKRIDKLDANE